MGIILVFVAPYYILLSSTYFYVGVLYDVVQHRYYASTLNDTLTSLHLHAQRSTIPHFTQNSSIHDEVPGSILLPGRRRFGVLYNTTLLHWVVGDIAAAIVSSFHAAHKQQ